MNDSSNCHSLQKSRTFDQLSVKLSPSCNICSLFAFKKISSYMEHLIYYFILPFLNQNFTLRYTENNTVYCKFIIVNSIVYPLDISISLADQGKRKHEYGFSFLKYIVIWLWLCIKSFKNKCKQLKSPGIKMLCDCWENRHCFIILVSFKNLLTELEITLS